MQTNQIKSEQAVALRTRRSFLGYQRAKSESIIILKHIEGRSQNNCIVLDDSEQQDNLSNHQREQRNEIAEVNEAQSQEQDEVLENQKSERKGRFTPSQQKIITDAVGQFLAEREISYQDFLILLNKKNVINTFLKKERFFNILASKLPGRTPFCCYRFVKRLFNNNNRKGKWTTQEEKRLVRLVEKYGHKWQEIAERLGRTSENVYDKFKALGCENIQKRSKDPWNLREFIQLLVQVNSRVQTKFLNNDIQKELQSIRYYNALQSLSQRQSRYHTKTTSKPFTDLAMRYVSSDIRRIDVEGVSWSIIASKLKKRSLIDCKNKFMQLFEYALRKVNFDDILIIEFVQRQNVEQEYQIDWLKWIHQSMCYQQAKNRYHLIKKTIPHKTAKKFTDILTEMRLRLTRRDASD